MNGPEHYAEAERLIEESKKLGNASRYFPGDPTVKADRLARAQVHATLAAADTRGSAVRLALFLDWMEHTPGRGGVIAQIDGENYDIRCDLDAGDRPTLTFDAIRLLLRADR